MRGAGAWLEAWAGVRGWRLELGWGVPRAGSANKTLEREEGRAFGPSEPSPRRLWTCQGRQDPRVMSRALAPPLPLPWVLCSPPSRLGLPDSVPPSPSFQKKSDR